MASIPLESAVVKVYRGLIFILGRALIQVKTESISRVSFLGPWQIKRRKGKCRIMRLQFTKIIRLFFILMAGISQIARAATYPAGEADRQFAILAYDLAHRDAFEAKTGQTVRPESMILDSDRDPLDLVLRRTKALLADLRRMPNAPDLAARERELAALTREGAAISVTDASARRALFDRALILRRTIAFANPLLDFSRLVFIKRNRALFNHTCDQYYGINANPGGGLYILEEPFGPNPSVHDLLSSATVAKGRLLGQHLSGGPARAWKIKYDGEGKLTGEQTRGGSFLSPELSYDGKTLLFAYVECTGDRNHIEHLDPTRGHWDAGRCYHLFKVNIDGSGLEQLTDGTFNDFDPCFMPSGRIAFTSERRGGYLRCGRTCPTYTLFDMAPDGSDIRCLSYHETNEWQPSVTNDGMIVWTRWDYIDRHGSIAHMPWITTPDGRDPRPIHGNYSYRYERPDMELDLRAIPGSRRFVATAAPHHGQSYGSLVLVDPRVEDDGKMAPVRRITPDVDFPESQKGAQAYGEAWPLNEDYFLCSYDPTLQVKALEPKVRYGLYLVDAFGNRELIYHDPAIGSHSPIPLRPRPAPPVIAEASTRVAEGQPAEATVGVVNVYNSLTPFPHGTKIKALRVYQIFPLSMACSNVTRQTGIQILQGINSVNNARAALGTVPVEEDGSAYFTAPARAELYFQVLDENGLAVQSMRSGTYFQPGEKQVCQGCHEPRRRTPPALTQPPLAMRRAPSRLVPEVDGANPFSYPRLVQPVLDRNCLGCHQQHPDKAPRLDTAPVGYEVPRDLAVKFKNGWMNFSTTFTTSYISLAPRFGFTSYGGAGYDDPQWYVTTPGRFGARASRLYALLAKGHHDVKLSAEDFHRLTLWLDSCSLFYGCYEKEGGEAQLRGEIVRPTLQ